MGRPEKSPQENSEQLAFEAKCLWLQLDSQFQGDLDPETYSAHLTLPVAPSSQAFAHLEYLNLVSGVMDDSSRRVDTRAPWRIGISHDDKRGELGINSVRVPVRGAGNEAIVYHATSAGVFLPAYEKDGVELSVPRQGDCILRSAYVGKLLIAAGYDLNHLGATPDEMRLKMAELIDVTSEATIEERITRPVDVVIENNEIVSSLSLHTTRVLERRLDQPTDAIESSSLVKKGEKHIPITEARPFFASTLQAISEVVDHQKRLRNQLVIEFRGSDLFINMPEIYTQTFEEVGIEILGDDSTKTYRKIGYQALKSDLATIQRIAMSIDDELL
jgi:hypothetical protein